MKYGFVSVAAVSPELKVADVKFNTFKIEEAIALEHQKGTEILVFPELCLCGYTCGDLFTQPLLIDACKAALKELAAFSVGIPMLIFVGLPMAREGKLYNCAAAICGGEILAIVPKRNIPNYSEFYEKLYFASAPTENGKISLWDGLETDFSVNCLISDVKHAEACVAVEICEDLWVGESPSIWHAAAGATIIVNLSASNELIGKAEFRRTLIKAATGKNVCAYVYAGAGVSESTTDVVFAGHNLISENGGLLAESELFSGKGAHAEIDVEFLVAERNKRAAFLSSKTGEYLNKKCSFVGSGELKERKVSPLPFVPKESEKLCSRSEFIFQAQAHALARRLAHVNAKTAVIGVSGGLDSSLALLVVARAFDILGKDRKEIVAVTMPGFGTTGKTYQNSLRLIECMGASGRSVDITKSVLTHFEDIGHDKEVHDVTYENAQARTRTLILMDIANQTNGLVIGTGDLSELALGWCTYNGDQMSMYGVNAGIPKTLVRHLIGYEAARLGGQTQEILEGVLGTAISPELLPPDKEGKIAQKTEDIVGPYELHDFFLFHALRRYASPKKILYLAKYAFGEKYSEETLKKWLKNFYKRFFSQQFKRSAMPDGVKIGSISLSPRGDLRMPSDASAALWLAELD